MSRIPEELWDSYFEDEKGYDSNPSFGVDIRFNIIKKFLKKGRILDVGFGSGYFLNKFSALGLDTYGFDLPRSNQNKLIEKFKRRNIKISFGTVSKFPFQDSFFDYVIASEVLEHLNGRELENALRNISRILKEGGKLILTVPCNEDINQSLFICPYCLKKFHPFLHEQSFDESKIMKKLSKYGFKKIRFVRFGTYFDYTKAFPFGLEHLISKLAIKSGIFHPFWLLAVMEK